MNSAAINRFVVSRKSKGFAIYDLNTMTVVATRSSKKSAQALAAKYNEGAK